MHFRKLTISLLVLLCAVCISISFVPSYSIEPAQNSLLADKHSKAGINCQGCDQETPPAKPVATVTCSKCHGNSETLAQRTQKMAPNPHASPHEASSAIKCESCHHAHKPSENSCATCHSEFNFKVP